MVCFGRWGPTDINSSYQVIGLQKALLAYYQPILDPVPMEGITFYLLWPKHGRCWQGGKQPLFSAQLEGLSSLKFNSLCPLSSKILKTMPYFLVVLVVRAIVYPEVPHPKQKQNSLWLSLWSHSRTSSWRRLGCLYLSFPCEVWLQLIFLVGSELISVYQLLLITTIKFLVACNKHLFSSS